MTKWNSKTSKMVVNHRLQNEDLVVQSIRDCREAYSEMDDTEFSVWYSNKHNLPYKRVKAIVTLLREGITT